MRKTCGKKGAFLLAAALALALAGCFTSIADDGSVPDGGDLVVSDENDSTGGGNEAQMPNGTENNDGTGGDEDQTPDDTDDTESSEQTETYTVTFDSGNGNAVAPQQVETGQTATKPADPTKEGYKFLGWYLGGEEFDFTTPITANITLTAQWLSYLTIVNGVVTKCDSSATGHITIPEGVTGIGNSAFFGCASLASVEIPEGVTSIEHYAFMDCTSLASVTIPASVTSIGGSAFFGCTRLASVRIPAGVESIGTRAFYGCTSLAAVTIPEGVTSIGYGAFDGCTSLAAVTIPTGVTRIGVSAFFGCTSLASVTFADTSNWHATTSGNYTGGAPIVVTNPTTNANNLKDRSGEWYSKYLYKTAQ